MDKELKTGFGGKVDIHESGGIFYRSLMRRFKSRKAIVARYHPCFLFRTLRLYAYFLDKR